jgi:hypothetical protein
MRLPTFERSRTMALLHRFMRTALSVGRMPSLVGREIFRMRVQARPPSAFEDSVLFVCDIEKCLALLDPLDQRLIAFCVLENRSEWEASRQFHASQGFISRHLGLALDLLHTTFCQRNLLPPLPEEMRSCKAEPDSFEPQFRRNS